MNLPSRLFPLLLALTTLPAAAQSDLKIRIAFPSGMNGIYPTVMERAGIAKKHGLDAEFAFFQNGPPMMEALAAGSVDAVITSLMPITLFLSKQPGKAVVVAQLGYSSHSLMVPRDSTVTGLADLKGKRIAVSFSTDSHQDLLSSLRAAGIDPTKDVKLLNTPPNELLLALSQNFAEAILIRQPQVLRLQQQFGAKIVQTWPFRFLSIMRSDYLAKNPEAQARYLNALRDSVFWTASNPEQASIWFGERLRLDPAIVRQISNEDPQFTKVSNAANIPLALSPEFQKSLEAWFKQSLEFGLIREPVSLKR